MLFAVDIGVYEFFHQALADINIGAEHADQGKQFQKCPVIILRVIKQAAALLDIPVRVLPRAAELFAEIRKNAVIDLLQIGTAAGLDVQFRECFRCSSMYVVT